MGSSKIETETFRDRHEAGRALAELLLHLRDSRPIVLGLPRGGVPVAYQVACRLRAPLDVFIVRKLGTPGQEELAMGAIASGGVRFLNEDIIDNMSIQQSEVDEVTEREAFELSRCEETYRGNRHPEALAGRTVILVDDGLATGSTMRAAAAAVRSHNPSYLVIAVPVASRHACADMQNEADEVICALTPEPFGAVGRWYGDFSQTSDAEVQRLLALAGKPAF